MEAQEILDLGREAMWVLIKVSAPIMIIALTVGLVVSLFQALTQIQEATLSFVPKMLAIYICLIFFMPYMTSNMKLFSEHIAEKIIQID